LHGEGKDFDVSPLGEVAAVKEITFTRLGVKDAPKSILEQAFGGSFFIQMLRILLYFGIVLSFLIFMAIFLPALARAKACAVEVNEKNSRKIKVVAFKTQQLESEASQTFAPEFDWLLNYYIEKGDMTLLMLNGIINDEMGYIRWKIPTHKYMQIRLDLLEKNVLKREGKAYVVDANFVKSVKAFGEFVIPDFENKSRTVFESGTVTELG